MLSSVPEAPYAIIGGSSTFSIPFPEACQEPRVEVLEKGLTFETPFGTTSKFKLLSFTDASGQRALALTTKMHGRLLGRDRLQASQALFWVLHQAGAKKIIAEGGVGSINPLLDPRDLVLPLDFIDLNPQVGPIVGGHLLRMRQALCPTIHAALLHAAHAWATEQSQRRPEDAPPRVFSRGVYVVTQGPRWESPAEVAVLRQWGADVVGQSLAPEVYLAREIGACYAGVHMVVNYAEGVVREWEHSLLRRIFFEDAVGVGRIILSALENLTTSQECGCMENRKESLLKYEDYDF